MEYKSSEKPWSEINKNKYFEKLFSIFAYNMPLSSLFMIFILVS